jgi:hypothetical protein
VTITLKRLDAAAADQYVLTGLDGYYRFDSMQAGTYQLMETQPKKFWDGKDTAGSLGGTPVSPDTITNIVLGAGQKGVEYNFGERGLLPQYISKRLFLASTPTAVDQVVRQLINDAPVVRLNGIAGGNYAATFSAGGGAVPVVNTTAATITHADGGWLSSMKVKIENLRDGDDEVMTVLGMLLTPTPQSLTPLYPKIQAAYANGVLTLTGPDETANFQAVLRTLTYRNKATSPDLSTRYITVVASDPVADSELVTTTLTMR